MKEGKPKQTKKMIAKEKFIAKENARKDDLRKEAGITLVALIIMVIVIVILAGITVRGITGREGILDQTMTTANEYNIEQYKEQIATLRDSIVLEYATKGKNITISELAEEMGEETTFVKSATLTKADANNNQDIIVTVTEGYTYQLYYDEVTGQKFIEYVGRADGKELPQVRAEYNTEKAEVKVIANDSEGIASIELIYRGEVIQKEENPASGEEKTFIVQKTGWYEIRVTSNSGKIRYAWVRPTSTVVAPIITLTGEHKGEWYRRR